MKKTALHGPKIQLSYLYDRDNGIGYADDRLDHRANDALPHPLEESPKAPLLRLGDRGGEDARHARGDPSRDVLASLEIKNQNAPDD